MVMKQPEVEITRGWIGPIDRVNAMAVFSEMIDWLRERDHSIKLVYCDVVVGECIVWKFHFNSVTTAKQFDEEFDNGK